MNRVDYINALKSALEVRKDELKEIEEYHLWVLECPDSIQLKIFSSLMELFWAFCGPMFRVLGVIETRIREEHMSDWDYSKCSYTLMTIENVFENMTHDISLDTACNIVIDKKLVCSPYAKSELKRSVKERNLHLFKQTIKEYDIDYSPASDLCSHICLASNMLGDMENRFEHAKEEDGNSETLSDEYFDKEFSLKYQACIEDLLSNVTGKLDEDGCSFEDITDAKQTIEWVSEYPLDFSSPDTLIESFAVKCVRYFLLSVHSLNAYAKANQLNDYDKHLIGAFIEKRKTEMAIVQVFFTLFTKGDVWGDDFVLMEVEDAEFWKMIEQCVYVETNEQQLLPDIENTGISNLEPVANPKLEDLPLPHVLAWDENKAREIVMRAIEKGYMKLKKKGKQYIYNWLNSGVALVYFCGRLCCGDYTKPDSEKQYNEWKQEDGETIPQKELLKLFLLNGKNLKDGIFQSRRKAKSKSDKSGPRPSPSNHKDIDELFENQQL